MERPCVRLRAPVQELPTREEWQVMELYTPPLLIDSW